MSIPNTYSFMYLYRIGHNNIISSHLPRHSQLPYPPSPCLPLTSLSICKMDNACETYHMSQVWHYIVVRVRLAWACASACVSLHEHARANKLKSEVYPIFIFIHIHHSYTVGCTPLSMPNDGDARVIALKPYFGGHSDKKVSANMKLNHLKLIIY